MKNMTKKLPIALLALTLASCTGHDPSPSSSVSSDESDTSESSASSESSSSSESSILVDHKALVSAAIAKGIKQGGVISTGSIKESESYGSSPIEKTYEFAYGADCFYYKGNTSYDYPHYLLKDSDGNVVPVVEYSFGLSKDYNSFNEANFKFKALGTDHYGTEKLISDLYDVAVADVNKDAKFTSGDDKYGFSCFAKYESTSYSWTSTYFATVSVSFSLGSHDEFASASISVSRYSESQVIELDDGTYQLSEGASSSNIMEWTITQVYGTPSYKSPYTLEGFKATSFDLMNGEAIINDGDTIEITKGSNANLTIANLLPSTANLSFDPITIEYEKESGLSGYASATSVNFSTYSAEIGTWNVTLKTTNITKTLKVNVKKALPESISATYYTATGLDSDCETGAIGEDNSSDVVGSTYDTYVGFETTFVANISPYAADQSWTASMTENEGATLTKIDDYKTSSHSDPEVAYKFVATQAGVYKVTFSSAVNAEVTKEVTINVSENAPTLVGVLSKKYAKASPNRISGNFDIDCVLDFSPSGEDASTGTLTVTKTVTTYNEETEENESKDVVTTVNYAAAKGEGESWWTITLSNVPEDADLSFDSLYVSKGGDVYYKKVTHYDTYDYVDFKTLYVANANFFSIGTYEYKNTAANEIFSLSLQAGGTATISHNGSDGYSALYCSYNVDESGKGALYDPDSDSTYGSYFADTTLPISFTINEDYDTITITIGGTELTLSYLID